MTIELTQDLEALVQKQLRAGRYASKTEVVAEALALLDDQTGLEQAKLMRLRAEIKKGLASSEPKPLDMDSIIEEAQKRYEERTA